LLSSKNRTKQFKECQAEVVSPESKPKLESIFETPPLVVRFDLFEGYVDLRKLSLACDEDPYTRSLKEMWPDIEFALKNLGISDYSEPIKSKKSKQTGKRFVTKPCGTMFSVRPKRYKDWRFKVWSPTTAVYLFGPIAHLDNPHYEKHISMPRKFKPSPSLDDIDRMQREDFKTPVFDTPQSDDDDDDESGDTGDMNRYYLKIRIRNQSKLYFSEYQEQLWLILWQLERAGLDIIPTRLEMSVDTLDRELGSTLLRSCYPRDFNPDYVYNYETGKYRRGPSPNGINDCHGYRPKGKKDQRPESIRPRGGTLGHHPHIHTEEIESMGGEVDIYRTEVQLFHRHIRYFMKKHNLTSPLDLIVRAVLNIGKLIRFKTVDLKKILRKDQIGLESMSTIGQIYTLLRIGYTRQQISKFLRDVKLPPLWVCLRDPEGPSPDKLEWLHDLYRLHYPNTFEKIGIDEQQFDALWVKLAK
jgi:hypothetical protein